MTILKLFLDKCEIEFFLLGTMAILPTLDSLLESTSLLEILPRLAFILICIVFIYKVAICKHDYQVVSKSSDKLLVSNGTCRETGFQELRKQFQLKLPAVKTVCELVKITLKVLSVQTMKSSGYERFQVRYNLVQP